MEASHANAQRTERRRLKWGVAFYAGLLAGVVFLLFTGGTPWSFEPQMTVMGRVIESPANAGGITGPALHMGLSIVYALIIAAIIYRMQTTPAVLVGGLCGAGLYLLNYLVASYVIPDVPGQRESTTLITHIVFGMLAAGAYKGLARPRAEV